MSTPIQQDPAPRPWYRQFWPWFVFGLPGATVIAGLATVWIAVVNRDALVSDDWYEDGTAINQRLDRRDSARRNGVGASLDLDSEAGIVLTLRGRGVDTVDRLRFDLRHPTVEARDRSLVLERGPDGTFHGPVGATLGAGLHGRWYATLEPLAGASAKDGVRTWQLAETLALPDSGPVSMTLYMGEDG